MLNALASLAITTVYVFALWLVLDALHPPLWLMAPILALGCIALASGRVLPPAFLTVGVVLLLQSALLDSALDLAVGAAGLLSWLLLQWELREALAVWTAKPLLLDSIDVGTATVLRGRVLLMHMFIDTPRRRWRPRTRKKVERSVNTAGGWLIDSAKNYSVDLRLEHVFVNASRVCYEGVNPCMANDYAERSEFELFLREQIQACDSNCADSVGRDLLVRVNRCLVVHVAESIGQTAFAVPALRRRSPNLCGVEYAVVGKWNNAAIYAHEILHLFGADDFRRAKYNVAGGAEWDEMSESLLRRSIMFDGYVPLEQVVVDELMAQCVGWM